MLYSAILPGAGQLYNEQIIKSSISFLGTTWALWNIIEKQQTFEIDNSTTNLESRNGSVWLFSLLYGLNILDAYVDAHLYDAGRKKSKKINDKAQHFLTNFASTITVNYYSCNDKGTNFLPAISINAFMSIGKEIWDLKGHGQFEWLDLCADIFGIGAGIWITNTILE